MSTQLQDFSDRLAAILPEVGSDRLPSLLLSMLRSLVPFDNAVILHYYRGKNPLVHYNDIPPMEREIQIDKFVASAFLLDPFYRAAVDESKSGLHRLSDLAPEGFEKTEYYRSYFKHTEIKDEVGYLFHICPDQFVNISLSRLSISQRFNRTQIGILSDISAVIETICKAQWAAQNVASASPDNQLPGQLDSALKHFGTAYLTDRECQVVQLFLHGHSTKSIAERLGISPETVKLHRKNSYAKLDVSSQAELFYLFIDSLASLTSYSGGDPLVGYL
ncbi:MAG: helix-turn-helix transcriptional regulator [Porticoccaceae bacterium]|jgi:DNA-binding CsgD family transcriptional regulator|nr:helix-turn-helix transcriptional regulator [Porticoccaceae bacterium]MBT5578118.1 helix-turn-helix transcriptional regulator [Porticoccaceae bacterium]MBT7375225.1 helix-turn-helix transcriptional regulator [Porticoccaceae bacterium]